MKLDRSKPIWTAWINRDTCEVCDADGYITYPEHHINCNGEACERFGCPVEVQDYCREWIHFANWQKVL